MAYNPIAFDPIAYDVTQSAVHVYTKDNSYWIPLKCLVEVYDNTGDTLLLSYDMFNPESNTVKLLECTVSLGLTNTQFTLKFEDGHGVINQNTIGLGNKILVYAGRSSDHLTLLFTGYSENRTPIILANNVMDYEMNGYGENAALNDLIVNFKRASSSLTDIEDPNFPKRPDSKMVVYELVKDLFEDRDVRATSDIILKNYLNLDISGISPLVTERLLSIVQSMTEVSQVLNFLTEVTGAYWNIENGKLYFEYPEVKHSGIIIKNKVAPTDLASSTSYFLGQWTYTDSISKDKGFANRIYTTTATDTKSIANSMTNKGATALFDRAIAVQVTLLETRLTTIALLLSKIGDPFTPLTDEELIIRGGTPNNPPPPVVTCPIGYHKDSTGQCVPDVIVTPPCPTGYHFDTSTQTCVQDDPTEPPPPTTTCPTDYIWSEAQGRCILDVTVPPPTGGDEGEFDEYGIKWMVARGEQSVVVMSRDEAADDRWSGNTTGLRNGLEATMIGRSSGTSGDAHFAYKGMGGNHSGSGAGDQRWYDFGIRSNGDVQLEWEGPHPSNHSFSLPSSKQFITNIGKGLEGNWIGLKWCFQTITPNGSPANGGVRCRMWVDTDPINTTTNKPNNNWRLCFDFIDGVDVEVIDPQDYEAPDEQDCEVRRSDTDSHDIYGTGSIVTGSGEGDPGLHVRRLGTPAVPHTCPTGFHWDTNLNQCVANPTNPTCPTGYHWDASLGVCVLDITNPPPPPPTTQPVLNISVFSDCDSGSELDDIFALIKSKNTHQIICCGDFTHTDAASSTTAYSAAGLDNLRTNAIWCRGNHEASNEDGSASVQNTIAAFFNTSTSTFYKKTRIQNVYIIGTDTNDPNFDSVGSTQYNYVLASLQEAAAFKAQGTVQWIIVAGHKPHYANSGSHHMPSEDDTQNAASVYQPLFNQYGVDLVFNGHNHTFQVSEPLTLNGAELVTMSGQDYDFSKPHGQFYINDGVCGRGNYEIGSINSNYRYINNSNAGFVFLSLDTTGLKMKVQLINETGSIIQEFNIVKTTSTTPPPGTSLKFNIAGDFRAGSDAEATALNLVSDTPNVMFFLGDYAVGDATETEWCNEIMAPVKNSNIPVWGLIGNHDNDNYLNVGFFENTQWVWQVKYGNIMFISCDTIAESVSATQTLVQAAQANSTITRIVILMHESVFKQEGGGTSGSDTTIAYHTMFKANSKVKLVIAGHSHNYTRFAPYEGITYVICEDGGQQPDDNTGCMHCSSDAAGNITCRMVTNLGVTLDTFTISATTGGSSAMSSKTLPEIVAISKPFRVSDPTKIVGKPCIPFDCPRTVRRAKAAKRTRNKEDGSIKQVHEATFSVDNKIIQSVSQLPEQVVRGEIRIDNENKPTGPVISQFKVEVGSLSSTADTIFVNDIKVDASVLSPNGKYWLVLLPCGLSPRHTVLWHHNGDMTTLDKYSAFAKGQTRNDLSDWTISRYGPTYGHAIFARLRRIQEYSDPQSIQKFRLKEDMAEADFLDDSLSVAKMMQNVLAIRGKPVREYSLNEVTLPTGKWFTPGQNVTIVDDTGHHAESSNIFAEIQECQYTWSTSQADSTIGTFKINVLPVGHLNWHRSLLEDNQ